VSAIGDGIDGLGLAFLCSLGGVGGFAAEQAQDNSAAVKQVALMRERGHD